MIVNTFFVFQFVIRARDNRDPERSANAPIQVKINRNNRNPDFQGQPYRAIITENTAAGGSVLTVVARDRDIQVGHTGRLGWGIRAGGGGGDMGGSARKVCMCFFKK